MHVKTGSEADARKLVANGCFLIGEVSNMGCTAGAVNYFLDNKIHYAPGKAVNAGGVAVSGLEMSQKQHALQLDQRGGR